MAAPSSLAAPRPDTDPPAPAEHAEETAMQRTRRILAAAKRRENSLRTHMRAQFHPWYWGGAIAAVAVVQQTAAALTAWPLAVTAPAAAAFWLGASWLVRKRLAKGWARFDLASDWVQREPGHARVCGWAAAAWLTGVHLAAPSTLEAAWWCAAAGLGALVACAARFWRHHRPTPVLDIGNTEADGDDGAGPPPPQEHPLARRWRTTVGSPSGCLSKSRLADVVDEPFGVTATLALDRLRHTISSARNAIPQIASSMAIPHTNIIIEEVEATEDNPNPDPARPTIRLVIAPAITKPVLLEAAPGSWEGSSYRIPLGPYTDGDGHAEYTLYSDDSMWGGFLAGATGTGKSNLVELIAAGAWASGVTKIIFLDPKNGGSSPRIKQHCDWFVGNSPPMWTAVMKGLITLIEARGAENSEELGTSGFVPTLQRPGVLVILEESHNIVTKHTAEGWGRITREGRAAGVACLMASQIFGLESFGGSDVVRESVTAGNTVALRVGANQSSMIKDVPLQPWRLPKVRGLAMIDTGRESVFRAAHAPPERKIDGEAYPHGTVSMERLLADAAAAAPAELDPLAVGALDEGAVLVEAGEDGDEIISGLYLARHEQAVTAGAQWRQRLSRLRARAVGHEGIGTATTPAPASAPGPEIDPAALPVVDLTAVRNRAAAEAERRRTDQAVLDALADGETRRGDLDRVVREACGAGRSSIHRALTRLQDRGLVEASPEWGTWRRIDS